MKNIVCFGEVLWDVFPSHKKIGGAPLNVALRLQSLDNNVSIISSIGDDNKGNKIKDFILSQGVNIDNLQVDAKLKTGKVKVMLNAKGSASYDIMFPRAWDNIQITSLNKSVTQQADAFIYGSLVARDENSRETLYQLLNYAKYKIFDVNLRAPYYTKEVLNHLMNEADFIKFNDEEIFEIGETLNSKTHSLEQNIKFLADHTNTKTICVTKGRHGAILYFNDTFYYNSGYHIEVVDTVGAGDSFLATLISKLLKGDNPQDAINYACAIGALVAGSQGANPKFSMEDINTFINP
ncbi:MULTISPECIES: carbohydrate kinase family protein [unclassified Olleya]|jgi:fructokinase|uniref:carbohydrate kinase family protein n=1 Tax=unclassified Olleya TaxID=2615019 RepID=UPI0011A2ED18|nr:carbohydrate kinase [Olleya sp. Hel_I_94]TVZ46544.1 fructokinase [Olleya sp. Hel_I_94]